MRKRIQRRIRNAAALLITMAAILVWIRARQQRLESSSFVTGYLLLAAVLFLAFYNLRKKLPFLPLGSSTAWLQWHLYVGIGTIGVFALHIGPAWPRGIFETMLAAAYLLTVASGLVGLFLTRTIPVQLTRVSEEIVYERIPAFRQQILRQANEVVLESVTASGATMLADFYAARLYDFFGRARGWGYLLRPTSARRRSLMRELQNLRRFLTEQEQAGYEQLFALVRRKDDLDFHDARQRLLKLWLFVHIGLTYVLVALAVLHGLLAHAFHGGAA
jgi:hypothetical protein